MSTLKKQQLFTVHVIFVNFEFKTVTVKTYGNEKKVSPTIEYFSS
jgi:hypothetical protein